LNFEVGLSVCDIVVKKFTSAISSPDEFLLSPMSKNSVLEKISSLSRRDLLRSVLKVRNA